MTVRRELLANLARSIDALPVPTVRRVAVDGVDGAGKTIFANELAEVLATLGRPTIRASVDGFHHPKSHRYRRGRSSPEGFFADSYDYEQLKGCLVDPLSPSGTLKYRTVAFDHRTDAAVFIPKQVAVPESVLVFDGIFLQRPELRSYWDFSIFLDVGFNVSIARAAQRDGGSPDPGAVENHRYIEGQRIYLETCKPKKHATVTINNEDLTSPYVVI